MPPASPGIFEDDYNELIDCYNNGPENTPGCNWMVPPGGNCNSEIIGQENDNLLGDLNNDLFINIQDIIITINLVLDGEYNSYADMNSDEIVNVLDIIQIVNIILNNQYRFNHHNNIKYINKWIK